ncbi:imidazolonepropionase [Bacteroides sp. GM023]|uniref:imidazolonepropionase n=1 Tax=Bacteroides sp. GM023 TaxID=2723058 RepID=UPI00168A6F4F|nr:imidazolonepropionase [Bacteroides sp. GM023]MBD3591279.1 imidazolonepropionase [Bacteroides sp. GM023]
MSENLIIFNARIVTPIGFSARKGEEMSQLQIIENGTVEVTKGIITYVGENRGEDRDGYYQHYWHYNARGHCLLPGFVDSHTHFVFGGERSEEFSWRLKGESYMSIMERGGGIASTVKATRKMNFLKLRSTAETFLKKMSTMGVTTVEGKSGYGLDRETELLQLKIMRSLNNDEHKRVDIVSTFLGAHALPEEYKGKSEEYQERSDDYIDFLIREMLPVVRENELAECCDVFCEQGVFSIEQSRRLLQAAKDQGFLLKLHADEIVSLGGAELAAELGALSADHLLHASDAGIRAMADTGVVATLLPLTAFALKEPYARGREMIDAGCAVALATDLNPGSCFSGSIPLTIALACIYMKLSVEETITALTLNGAAALQRADRIGSIEVGKQGDFVVLNSANYHILPYYIGMNSVIMTIKGGMLYPAN